MSLLRKLFRRPEVIVVYTAPPEIELHVARIRKLIAGHGNALVRHDAMGAFACLDLLQDTLNAMSAEDLGETIFALAALCNHLADDDPTRNAW